MQIQTNIKHNFTATDICMYSLYLIHVFLPLVLAAVHAASWPGHRCSLEFDLSLSTDLLRKS